MSDDLCTAFETTRYRVFFGNDSHVLHIGAPCPEPVARWLALNAAGRCAWLMTGYNPNAEQIDVERNRARDAILRAWAGRRASAWLETVNETPHGNWPDEPGVLIVGIEEGEVRAFARRLGQLAVVCVSVGGPVELVWSGPSRAKNNVANSDCAPDPAPKTRT